MQELLAGRFLVPGAVATDAVEQLIRRVCPVAAAVEADGEFQTRFVVVRIGVDARDQATEVADGGRLFGNFERCARSDERRIRLA